ncbi:MAG: permease [Treponema sp.]
MHIIREASIIHALTLFTGTWLEAVPFLLLGIIFSAVVHVIVPDGFLQKQFPRNPVLGICFGVLGGFFFPVCDCASVPVFRSLVKKGIPLPAAVAFLTAAPIINPVVMLSTWYAYGGNGRIVLARSLFGIICSVLIASTFLFKDASDFIPVKEGQNECCTDISVMCRSFSEKTAAVISYSCSEFIEAGSWQTAGIAVATLFQLLAGSGRTSFLSFHLLRPSGLGLFLSIVLMMGIAYMLSLCSTSDAVICSVIGKNFPPVAQLAFLVFGPMMDIKNTILLGGMCSWKLSARMVLTTFVECFCVMAVFAVFGSGVRIL